MDYKVIDKERYYRKGVYEHFTKDCKCSTSMTARIDVTELVKRSECTNSKFYVDFLYVLTKVLNSREDYRMGYIYEKDELICYDKVNPTHYVFHEDSETCTPVYSEYHEDYRSFYKAVIEDIKKAKESKTYNLDSANHPNNFEASYISWISYDSLNLELPDGYLYFAPIINWGRYREEDGKLVMPVSVRMNHAIADGYLVALVFKLLEQEIAEFCKGYDKMEVIDGKFILKDREDGSMLLYCQDIKDLKINPDTNEHTEDKFTVSIYTFNAESANKLRNSLSASNYERALYDRFYVNGSSEDWFDSTAFAKYCNEHDIEYKCDRRNNIWFRPCIDDNIRVIMNYLKIVEKLDVPAVYPDPNYAQPEDSYWPLSVDLDSKVVKEVQGDMVCQTYEGAYDILKFNEISRFYL